MSDHYIRCRLQYDGRTEWACFSTWSQDVGTLRVDHQRVSYHYSLRAAQKWARRWKIECPTEPEPPVAPKIPRTPWNK